MKIGIIVWGNYWVLPFIKIYTEVLEKYNIEYEIVSWNRDGSDKEIGFQYQERQELTAGALQKFFAFYRYAKFVKRTILTQKFDKLIVFNPQCGIFIHRLLKKYYSGKYIFDYRDLSIEQKRIFKRSFDIVLKNSYANVISSPGFKKCLPNKYEYILSHNFQIETVKDALLNQGTKKSKYSEVIDVLTIGSIRDYESNTQVIDALADKKDYSVRFVGKGPSAEPLKHYTEERKAKNVTFEGYYPKEKEKEYIESCTFLNIFYPRKLSHDTAISNRFYNSLIYHKPMITTADTVQGNYAVKYGVGVALKDCENLDLRLKEYLQSEDYKHFSENAHNLLNQFVSDYEKWESVVLKFFSQNKS